MARKPKSDRESEKAIRGVDLNEVERLLVFMQKHRLEQFEYERDGVHIMLKKASGHSVGDVRPARVSEPAANQLMEEPASVSLPAAELPVQSVEGKAVTDELHLVKSPIVGTYYAAASPDAEPFVRVKAQVEEGEVLCIIEAMKLMNEIEADVAGEVAKIFVENGHPVEYGQPLFAIRPDRKR